MRKRHGICVSAFPCLFWSVQCVCLIPNDTQPEKKEDRGAHDHPHIRIHYHLLCNSLTELVAHLHTECLLVFVCEEYRHSHGSKAWHWDTQYNLMSPGTLSWASSLMDTHFARLIFNHTQTHISLYAQSTNAQIVLIHKCISAQSISKAHLSQMKTHKCSDWNKPQNLLFLQLASSSFSAFFSFYGLLWFHTFSLSLALSSYFFCSHSAHLSFPTSFLTFSLSCFFFFLSSLILTLCIPPSVSFPFSC